MAAEEAARAAERVEAERIQKAAREKLDRVEAKLRAADEKLKAGRAASRTRI